MKKILAAILVTLMTGSVALADQLKITVDVSATGKTTEILGADILADIDGRITEINVTPDGNTPFKLNLKGGAFRLRSMYVTKAQLRERDEKPVEPEVTEAK